MGFRPDCCCIAVRCWERHVRPPVLSPVLGDVPAATAIPDRCLESAEVIQITGRSFRLHGHQADKYSAMPEEESEESGSKPATSKTGQTRTPGPVGKTNRKSSK
jgi:hypothetical protein